MQENYLVPKYLDAPPMFLMVEADTAVFAMMGFIVGFVTGQLLLIVFGLYASKRYARVKSEGGRGIMPQFLYWVTPDAIWKDIRPKSYVRDYLG